MTAREKAFVQITTKGVDRIEYVDGRLGSGRILLPKLRKSTIGHKEARRIAAIDEDWKDALLIAFAAADKVRIRYKGVFISAEQAHRYRTQGIIPQRGAVNVPPLIPVLEPVNLLDDNVIFRVINGAPFTSLAEVVANDVRFHGLTIVLVGDNMAVGRFLQFVAVAHLFFDEVSAGDDIDGKSWWVKRKLERIGQEMAEREVDPPQKPDTSERLKTLEDLVTGKVNIAGTPNMDPALLTTAMRPVGYLESDKFKEDMRNLRQLAQPILLGITMITGIGVNPYAEFAKAAKRFDKKARKAGKQLKINNQ